jgi:hypothetical protein
MDIPLGKITRDEYCEIEYKDIPLQPGSRSMS